MTARYAALLAWAVSLYPLSMFWFTSSGADGFKAIMFIGSGLLLALACALVSWKWPVGRAIAAMAAVWVSLGIYVAGPAATLAFLLYGAAALSLGAALLVRLDVFSPVERAMLAYLVGVAILVAALSPFLYLPIHIPAVYTIVCVVLCVTLRGPLAGLAAGVLNQCQQSIGCRSPVMLGTLSLLTSVVWLIGALGTLTPIAAYDDLVGHLRLPYELLVRHHFGFDVQRQIWAVAPWASDLAFAIPFVISQGNEGVKVWVAGSYHLAAAVLLLGMLVRKVSAKHALVLLMAYLCVPLVLAVNHTMHTEGLSAALTLALFSLWVWQRQTTSMGVLLCVALLLALLGSIKSSNLLLCLFLGSMWLPAFWRTGRAWPMAGLAILGALATVLTPYVTALTLTGNPVFPLFNAIFKSPYYDAVSFSNARFAGMFDMGLFSGLFLEGQRHLETALPTVGGLALYMLLPSTIVLLAWRGDVARRYALLIALGYALVLLSSQQYLRYLFPVMGITVFAASMVFDSTPMSGAFARFWNGWWLVLLGLCICINSFSMPAAFWQTNLPSIVQSLSPTGKVDYLANYAPERALTQAANLAMGEHATVLYGGDPFGADLYGTPIYPNWYNQKALKAFWSIKDTASAAEFVREMRLTHAIPIRPTTTLPPEERAIAQVLDSYIRANGRTIATSGHDSLIALGDGIVWPRLLWSLDTTPAGVAISAERVMSFTENVRGGELVLFEMAGSCDGMGAIPRVDIVWLRQGRVLKTNSRIEACSPPSPNGAPVFATRLQLQAPVLADSMSLRLAGVNNTTARLAMAQARLMAISP